MITFCFALTDIYLQENSLFMKVLTTILCDPRADEKYDGKY